MAHPLQGALLARTPHRKGASLAPTQHRREEGYTSDPDSNRTDTAPIARAALALPPAVTARLEANRVQSPPPADQAGGAAVAAVARALTPPPADHEEGAAAAPRAPTPPPADQEGGAAAAPRALTPPPADQAGGAAAAAAPRECSGDVEAPLVVHDSPELADLRKKLDADEAGSNTAIMIAHQALRQYENAKLDQFKRILGRDPSPGEEVEYDREAIQVLTPLKKALNAAVENSKKAGIQTFETLIKIQRLELQEFETAALAAQGKTLSPRAQSTIRFLQRQLKNSMLNLSEMKKMQRPTAAEHGVNTLKKRYEWARDPSSERRGESAGARAQPPSNGEGTEPLASQRADAKGIEPPKGEGSSAQKKPSTDGPAKGTPVNRNIFVRAGASLKAGLTGIGKSVSAVFKKIGRKFSALGNWLKGLFRKK